MLGGVNSGLSKSKTKKEPVRSKNIDELDTYVKAKIGSASARTKTVEDAGSDPVFEEKHKNVLTLPVRVRRGEEDIEPELKLAIWDDDPGLDEFLGQVTVPLWALTDPGKYTAKMNAEAAQEAKQVMNRALATRKEFMQSKGGLLVRAYDRSSSEDKTRPRRMSNPDVALPMSLTHPGTTAPKKSKSSAESASHVITAGATKRLLLRNQRDGIHKGSIEIKLDWKRNTWRKLSVAVQMGGSDMAPHPPSGPSPAGPSAEQNTKSTATKTPSKNEQSSQDDGRTLGFITVTILRASGLEVTEKIEDDDDASAMMLIVSVAAMVLYVATGVLFYCNFGLKDNPEYSAPGPYGNITTGDQTPLVNWTVLDAIYFCVVTFTTVGYGDLLPHDPATRMFTAFYALVGVALIGFALGIITSYIVEMVEAAMEDALKAAKAKGISPVDAQRNVSATRITNKKESLKKLSVAMVLLVFGGAALFRYHEPDGAGEDWWTAIYVSIITASSVGYGDFSFTTPWGRACGIINTLVGVLLCARYIGNIADLVIDMQASRVYEKKLRRAIKPADILRMDDGDDGEVDRLEFLCAYLVNLGKVEKEDIDEVLNQFDVLDADGSGTLSMDDLPSDEPHAEDSDKPTELPSIHEKMLGTGAKPVMAFASAAQP